MSHIVVTTCRVEPERMKEFLGVIQQWEPAIEHAEHPPAQHSLYVNQTDPSQVLLITSFENAEHAEQFRATGLLDEFTDRVLSCAAGEAGQDDYDLYYAVGPDGPSVVFGEASK